MKRKTNSGSKGTQSSGFEKRAGYRPIRHGYQPVSQAKPATSPPKPPKGGSGLSSTPKNKSGGSNKGS